MKLVIFSDIHGSSYYASKLNEIVEKDNKSFCSNKDCSNNN